MEAKYKKLDECLSKWCFLLLFQIFLLLIFKFNVLESVTTCVNKKEEVCLFLPQDKQKC